MWGRTAMWDQIYNPLDNATRATVAAAIPVVTLLVLIASGKVKAHIAAIIALIVANIITIFVYTMPAAMSFKASLLGVVVGFFPIGWIVLNVIFLYRITVATGRFELLQRAIGGVTTDRRLQLLLIAFAFGAFFEGASGFGTPVAITGALLIGLGSSPLAASGLSLIANPAPVAYGALGTPIVGLASVTGLDPYVLGAMVGRQLPFFSVLVPFWLIWAFAGFRGMIEIWPAILVAGACFAIPQFLVSNFHGPWLVDVAASIVSIAALALFLKFWQPKTIWRSVSTESGSDRVDEAAPNAEPNSAIRSAGSPAGQPGWGASSKSSMFRPWLPWIILSVVVFVWGLPQTKGFLDH